MKPIKTEEEVLKNLKKEKTIMVKKTFTFKSIKDFFKKLAGILPLFLMGCCPHFMKCVP